MNKVFVDSNIWLYLFLQDDDEKYQIAEEYLLRNNLHATFIITCQVINEVSNNLLRNGFTEIEIRENIDFLFKVCTLQEFTKDIVKTASILREKYSFSFWDSILVGSALISNCDIFASEDMQDGLLVDHKLLIKNIFHK
jgi:predicted nucleic acid-binding protein